MLVLLVLYSYAILVNEIGKHLQTYIVTVSLCETLAEYLQVLRVSVWVLDQGRFEHVTS
jgi:hypothetical protein